MEDKRSHLVEVEAQLDKLFSILVVDCFTHLADTSVLTVVELAIIEHQFHIIGELSDVRVFLLFQLLLNRAKVHRSFYNRWIVRDVQLLDVDWVMEDPCGLVLPKSLKHSLRCFLPVIINWGTFVDVRDSQLLNWTEICTFWRFQKVFCYIWVFDLELLKFLISQRFVVAALSESCEQITAWNSFFVFLLFRLVVLSNDVCLLLSLYLLKCLLFSVHWWSSAVCDQKLDNLVFVVFLRKLKRRHLFFVLVVNVDSLLDQVFNSLKPTTLDCVEQRCLSVLVDDVDVCSV